MMLRSLAGLLVSVMMVMGYGDEGRGKRFSPLLASNLGGLGDVFEDAFLSRLLGGVERFATLPEGSPNPEGIAADKRGNIYVATFSLNPADVQRIHVFGRDGRLRTTILLPGVLPLGLAFGRGPDPNGPVNLYVADFGGGRVLRFEPPFTASSTAAQSIAVCDGAGAGCGLNALAFDEAGDLYASDSFGGRIFKIDLPGGLASLFFEHNLNGVNLLAPTSHGFPPFGANGLAFKDNALFIANTADDRILKLDLTPPLTAASLTTFAESVNGADGILFDHKGRLWVAANQADELVALNEDGRVVERRGAFLGIGRDKAPKGLLFPASIVLSRGSIFVTNLALALTGPTGDEPEEEVETYTVSRIRLGFHD